MAVCIAVLDRNSKPLKLVTNDLTKEQSFHYVVHTSLDVIEEKCLTNNPQSIPGSKPQEPPRELYLGVLYSTEQYKVFGYETNSKVKFIIIVDASNTTVRDNEIRQMFRRLHLGYSQMLSNPFYIPDHGNEITSKHFDKIVRDLLFQKQRG